MREGAKQRLAGAVVIVALVVIFVPMLVEQRPPPPPELPLALPSEPALAPRFESESYLTPETSGIGGLDEARISEPLPLPPPESAFAPASGPTLEPALEPASQPLSPPGVLSGPPGAPPQEAPVPAPSAASAPAQMPRVTSAPAASAPPRSAQSLASWVVQVASLGTSESAAELEARLRAKGYSAFVEEAEVNGKRFYRVRIGPMTERAEAERSADRLRSGEGLDPLVQRYP